MAKTSRGRKQWLTWSRGVPCGSPLKVDCEWRSRHHHAWGPWGTLWGDVEPCRFLILKCDGSFSELLSPSPYLQDTDVFGLECKPGNWDVYSVLWESVQRSWKLLMSIVFCPWDNDTDYFFKESAFQRLFFLPIISESLWTLLNDYFMFSWVSHWKVFQWIVPPGALVMKNPLANAGDSREGVWSLGGKDPLEEEMAPHPSIIVWRIPWTEEPGGLQSVGSQRVRHYRAINTHTEMY